MALFSLLLLLLLLLAFAAAAAAAAAAVVTSETLPNAPEPSLATRRRSESLGEPPFFVC